MTRARTSSPSTIPTDRRFGADFPGGDPHGDPVSHAYLRGRVRMPAEPRPAPVLGCGRGLRTDLSGVVDNPRHPGPVAQHPGRPEGGRHPAQQAAGRAGLRRRRPGPSGLESAAAIFPHERRTSQRRAGRRHPDRQQYRGAEHRPADGGLDRARSVEDRGGARRPDGPQCRLRQHRAGRPVPEQLARHRPGPVPDRTERPVDLPSQRLRRPWRLAGLAVPDPARGGVRRRARRS